MQFYGSLAVEPDLPTEIEGLGELAYNLWWSWNDEGVELFKKIDPILWEEIGNNPVKFLKRVSHYNLQMVADDLDYLKFYQHVMSNFHNYLSTDNTWFKNNVNSVSNDRIIAYFSAEFGLHESLPIYSGGLGVLAGDHCKSASDLDLPFVAVGLLYRNGYFNQKINNEGWQKATYPELDFTQLPIKEVIKQDGQELIVSVSLAQRQVDLKVWQVNIGRINLYLLDADLPQNSPEDRKLTSRLYGGGSETRISQEIILGVGGTRALYKLGYYPGVWHMNEGHSAYLGLERIRDLIKEEDLNFYQALEKVSSNTVFTTHTPVPAGNEVFDFSLKEKYFSNYWHDVGLSKEEFMKLGMVTDYDEGFGLTVLALRLAKFNNGVSRLHGQVASRMWKDIWPNVPTEENPLTHITNGIHTLTWIASDWKGLFDKYLSKEWYNHIEDKDMWKKVQEIPEEEFWQTHQNLKAKMISYIRKKDLSRKTRYRNSLEMNQDLLDKNKLTIGFARRFATYKRATLILKDIERLKRICNREGQEVQFIFAGKAHPADIPGQELIKKLHDISESPEFKNKVIILEDYDMELARYMVQGVDVWLNNPRRPLEASGTSGQKVAANGGLNFSVLDGWWCEGYNGSNGWVIGHKSDYSSKEEQDLIDSQSLYRILEEEIVPLYYDTHNSSSSTGWVDKMKETMITNAPEYSTSRMVQEYTTELYLPAMNKGVELNDDQKVIELKNWKDKVRGNWNKIKLHSKQQGRQGNYSIKEEIYFSAKVDLNSLNSDDIQVEAYLENKSRPEEKFILPLVLEEDLGDNIYQYGGGFKLQDTGEYRYTFRVIPDTKRLVTKHELGLIKWI